MLDPASHWYVVQTDPRHEAVARRAVDDAGIVAYLPMMLLAERHGRNSTRTVPRPVFPGYLFCRCAPTDTAFNAIGRAKGVHHILGAPTPIHDQAIEIVQLYVEESLAKEAKLLRDRNKGYSGMSWPFSKGQRVLIRSGPFSGFYADLQQAVDKQDRVLALIKLFNGVSRVELSAFDLEEPAL